MGAGYFVDVPLDKSPQSLYGAEVHIQKTAADDTLLLFLLCMIESLGLMKDRERPAWELYLNLYGRVAQVVPLSEN